MKYRMRKLLPLFLVTLLLLPTLTSCREKSDTDRLLGMWERDRAFALYDLLMENLSAADAYTVETEMEYEFTLRGGQTYRTAMTARDICVDQNGPDLFEISAQTVSTACGGDREESTYVIGYADSHIFRSQTYDGLTTAQKTSLSPEEYREFYANRAAGILIQLDYWECASVSCRQLNGGGWEARFSGFGQSSLDDLQARYGVDFSTESDLIYLTAAEVTVNATEDFRFDTVFIALDYSRYDEGASSYTALPTVRYTLQFGDWNTAVPESVDLSEYTDIGDLRVLDTFVAALDARKTADRGGYIFTLDQTVTKDGESQSRHFSQDIIFDTVERAFSLIMDGEYRDYDGSTGRMLFDYSNGVANEDGTKSSMTDAEARATLASRVDIPEFYTDDVTRIEVLDEAAGKYRLHLGCRMRQVYAETYEDADGKLTVFESYVDVTVRDYVLYAYTHVLHTGGYTKYAENQDSRVEETCIFDKNSQKS